MNLKHLKDLELLANTESAAQQEREATTRLLWHLWEVDRRKLFLKTGAGSLFDYCVRVLKMSEPQAARRVNAARALAEFPELEGKINSGAITLTTASQAQSFFNREARAERPKDLLEKKRIFQALENRSVREADKILLAHTPDPLLHRPEKYREISVDVTEMRLTLDQETMTHLERLREIWSHEMPAATFSDVIKKMAVLVRNQIDPLKKAERAANRESRNRAGPAFANSKAPDQAPTPPPESHRSERRPPPLRAPIPSTVRHHIWLKEGGCCTYKDQSTGRMCGSRHRLQVDHIRPVALGGTNAPENLRLRCANHNQWHARQSFGARNDSGERSLYRTPWPSVGLRGQRVHTRAPGA